MSLTFSLTLQKKKKKKHLFHDSRVELAALHNVGRDILNHPPYSPNIAASDYYLFPKMKKQRQWKKLISDEEMILTP